jgi:hypothetical protein
MQYVNQVIAATWVVLVAILLVSGLCDFGSFVPSPWMVDVTVRSATVLGLVSATFFCGFGAFGWGPEQQARLAARPAARRPALFENRYFRGLIAGLFTFGLTWTSLGSGLPWMLTLVLGHPGEMSAVVDGWATHRSCLHPTLRHVPSAVMNGHTLCTYDRVKAAMPPGTSIRIVGRVSPFGVVPDAIRQ